MSLAQKAASGFLWTSIAGFSSRLVTIASTFILTRHLAPAVQGEVNLASVLVLSVGAAFSLGIMQYTAAHPAEGRGVLFQGHVLIVLAGVVASALSLALSGPTATWLGVEGMVQYVPGLALAHFIDRLGWIPRSLLLRDLRFRTFGLRVALGELSFAAVSVGFAQAGFGGNSIVFGSLVRSGLSLVFLLFTISPREYLTPCRFALATVVRMLRFGLPITMASFLSMGAANWDNSFMGYRFGEATVGIYNQAYRLADLPASTFGDQINDVLIPTFARLPDQEARRRGFLRAAALLSLLVFPAATGLSVVAPTLVAVFYPPSYAAVAPFLLVLASLNMTRAVGNLAGAFLQVVDRTAAFVWIDLLLLVTVLGLMALLAPFGAVAASAGVGIAFTLAVVLTVRVLSPEGISLSAVGAACVRPLLACVPLALAVFAVRHALASAAIPGWLALTLEVAAGALAYVAAALLVARTVARDFIELGLSTLRRRRAKATDSG